MPILTEDFDTLVPAAGGVNRRAFVQGALGSGFAASVLPVMAQTVIQTDATGLVAGEVMIPVGDFRMPAYRAAPAGRAGLPVVLVVSEIFGVHEHIADVARRFAKAGYLAIAPELVRREVTSLIVPPASQEGEPAVPSAVAYWRTQDR